VEPTVNANPNSMQYEIAPSSHPYGLYFGECLVEPAQYSFIERDRNSSGIAINMFNKGPIFHRTTDIKAWEAMVWQKGQRFHRTTTDILEECGSLHTVS
jgi:hypothetical protein